MVYLVYQISTDMRSDYLPDVVRHSDAIYTESQQIETCDKRVFYLLYNIARIKQQEVENHRACTVDGADSK